MDNVFKGANIQPLDINELNGKILKIVVVDNEDATLIAGKDMDSKMLYVLNYQTKPKLKPID